MHPNDDQIRGEKLLAQAFEHFARKWAPSRDEHLRQEFRIELNEIILQTFRVAQDPPFRHLALVTAQLAHPLKIYNINGMDEEKPSLPETKTVTLFEGGNWLPFMPGNTTFKHVHAIKFADGNVWDSFNGWRHQTPKGG